MRKIIFITLIINFPFLNCPNCQGTFLKRYEIAGYENNAYFTTILATDSCYWAFGTIWDTSKPYFGGTALFKFDLQGNLLKQKELISKTDFYGFNNDMYANQNKLYTSILNPYTTSSVIAYDILGDSFQIATTVGNLLPEGDFLSINNLHFDLLGNFYLANAVSSSTSTDLYGQIQLVKFNYKFEQEWKIILGDKNIHDIPYSITSDQTGRIYIGAQRIKENYIQGDANYSRSIIYELSNEGKIVKETTADRLSGAVYDFVIDEQGNYICASEVLLPYHPQRPFAYPAYQKVDKGGNVLFRQYFEEAPKKEKYYSNFSKIQKVRDYYYALGGIGVLDEDIQPLTTESKAIFVKFDEEGNLIWKRIYNTAFGIEGTNLYDFDITRDNGFIMNGLGAIGTNDGLDWKSLLMKVDSFGCLVPGCHLTDNVNSEIKKIGLKIFPNPASDYLALYNETNFKLVIQIFDINGKELSKFVILSNETSIVDVSKYPVGSYMMQAFVDGKPISSEMFVKE
ncbi:MAG: T9SS type A sorting domain-containing protein [Bacteroidota bacterium]|nr:T9SS type A sorting domain-containing protein [Bacteroidota bacterium]